MSIIARICVCFFPIIKLKRRNALIIDQTVFVFKLIKLRENLLLELNAFFYLCSL